MLTTFCSEGPSDICVLCGLARRKKAGLPCVFGSGDDAVLQCNGTHVVVRTYTVTAVMVVE